MTSDFFHSFKQSFNNVKEETKEVNHKLMKGDYTSLLSGTSATVETKIVQCSYGWYGF